MMSPIRRALLYIARKRGKSVLLILLFFAISSLALAGISIRSAVRTAQLNVRQALGGVFTMEQNTKDASKWKTRPVGNYGYQSYYAGARLTAELADTIERQIDGIRGSNATTTIYAVVSDLNGKTLQLIESDQEGGMDSLFESFGDFNSTVAVYAGTNTAFDSSFMGGYLELTSGRHVTGEDQNAVMLSRELAEKNGLSIGDRLILHMSEFKASAMGIDPKETEREVEIVGLFSATSKSSAMLSNWTMDNAVFTTLDVACHVRPDTLEEGFERIHFYVDDPAKLGDIAAKVQALPEIDPTDFIVKIDSSSADSVAGPLENTDRLVLVLILLVLLIGAAILYLVLAVRIKERVHESGILLALGFSKTNIACQYLTEVLVLALLAFTLSVPASSMLARTVGGVLLDYTAEDADTSGSDGENNMPGTSWDGNVIMNSDDFAPKFTGQSSLTSIEVAVQPSAVLFLYGAGFTIVILSVLAAAVPVLRMKPQEILAHMS